MTELGKDRLLVCIVLFVKSATPRRIHVTEMKYIPQIRYSIMHRYIFVNNPSGI
jgi:hypothetical protein